MLSVCFFFNDTATTEIYTLSLHDALPISASGDRSGCSVATDSAVGLNQGGDTCKSASPTSLTARCPSIGSWRSRPDRKSTRLNSSHANISYAVFCLKKKSPELPTNSASYY